ncbi:MAG: sulfotransferase domain-containing protein [Planctomycetes bacterium]|jgi:hypothetical protein|nr:sulfotransferase domain-containing protein [Planctomycetota bacterium]
MESVVKGHVSYETLYPKRWKCLIFNHPRSFWDESYGIPLNSHPAGKIVVFGFPKSGNVWLKSLLVDYFGLPPVEPMFDVAKPGIGITHRPLDRHVRERADFLHGACIIRDLRDVIVSFFKYTQTNRFRSARPEFHYDDLTSFYFDWFLSRAATSLKVMTHSERYARFGVPIVRYEKLRADTQGELRRLLLRWGLPIDEAKIQHAVAANQIEKLRKEGKSLEKEIAPEHFRVGAVGTFREDLPEIVLRDIETRFAHVLRRWGYLA